MDSYLVAESIIGFSDFVKIISQEAFGSEVEIVSSLKPFQKGSFELLHTFDSVGITETFLSTNAHAINELVMLMKGCIALFNHLKGKPPANIIQKDNGIAVVNNYGEIKYVDNRVFNITVDKKTQESVSAFIKKPLDSKEVNTLSIETEAEKITIITKDDVGIFSPFSMSEQAIEWERVGEIIIESPVFKDGNKWKFIQDGARFSAEILDQVFLDAVNKGNERFGKGDRLVAKVKFKQSPKTMKIFRQIIQVFEHKEGEKQNDLL